jgi:hypothetical protein
LRKLVLVIGDARGNDAHGREDENQDQRHSRICVFHALCDSSSGDRQFHTAPAMRMLRYRRKTSLALPP